MIVDNLTHGFNGLDRQLQDEMRSNEGLELVHLILEILR